MTTSLSTLFPPRQNMHANLTKTVSFRRLRFANTPVNRTNTIGASTQQQTGSSSPLKRIGSDRLGMDITTSLKWCIGHRASLLGCDLDSNSAEIITFEHHRGADTVQPEGQRLLILLWTFAKSSSVAGATAVWRGNLRREPQFRRSLESTHVDGALNTFMVDAVPVRPRSLSPLFYVLLARYFDPWLCKASMIRSLSLG